jgi:hypothetical protein
MMEHNTRTFAHVVMGVHGHELPKFAEAEKVREFWKLRDQFYNPQPMCQSRLEYAQQVKYWAKPDELRLFDGKTDSPIDPLKQTHVPQAKKGDVCEKVTQTAPFKDEPAEPYSKTGIKPGKSRNWESLMAAQRHSVYDDNPRTRPSLLRQENAPLYSSFSPNKQFKERFRSLSQLYLSS